jgi:hypothetical protein
MNGRTPPDRVATILRCVSDDCVNNKYLTNLINPSFFLQRGIATEPPNSSRRNQREREPIQGGFVKPKSLRIGAMLIGLSLTAIFFAQDTSHQPRGNQFPGPGQGGGMEGWITEMRQWSSDPAADREPWLRDLKASGTKSIGYNGYAGFELCHPLPVVNGQTVGLDFVDKNAQLAGEYMRGILAEAKKQHTTRLSPPASFATTQLRSASGRLEAAVDRPAESRAPAGPELLWREIAYDVDDQVRRIARHHPDGAGRPGWYDCRIRDHVPV